MGMVIYSQTLHGTAIFAYMWFGGVNVGGIYSSPLPEVSGKEVSTVQKNIGPPQNRIDLFEPRDRNMPRHEDRIRPPKSSVA